MQDIDLTPKLKAKMLSRPRVRSRYNSSELFFLVGDKVPPSFRVTPEKFLKVEEKDIKQCMDMWNGIGVHEQIQGFFNKANCEIKTEYFYEGLTLVAKADHIPPEPNEPIHEYKSSIKLMKEMKPWHEYQAKLYCTLFKREKAVIYQPLQDESGIYLKAIGEVTRDDVWFEAQMKKLKEFDTKVQLLWEKR